jgi:DNA recombination protein Rad52
MSGFGASQVKELKGKLRAAHVRTRIDNGLELSYIEGWFTIAEANRIFGFDGWSRETTHIACVWEGSFGGRAACNYTAKVRISVHTGVRDIIREGSGFGGGSGNTSGEAHEMAIKEAETDAMKRALVTFGNRFGLALYDPEQRGVSRTRWKTAQDQQQCPVELPGERTTILCNTAQEFYSELRKQLESLTIIADVQALWHLNESSLKTMRESHPYLADQNGIHYTAVFAKLCKKRIETLQSLDDSPAHDDASPQRIPIDKSVLAIGTPKRIRNRDHLKSIATQPCLICGRTPVHAHHLTFAQPHARGLKTSDEWVVPLCALHHRELHGRGNERAYWQEKKINALQTAQELWEARLKTPSEPVGG